MKKLAILLLGVTFLLFSNACTKKEYESLGSISGTCIDDATGDPVEKATVTLTPTARNTYTGMDGKFEYTDLEAQQYTVTVQKSGYESNRHIVQVYASKTSTVDFVMKKETAAK